MRRAFTAMVVMATVATACSDPGVADNIEEIVVLSTSTLAPLDQEIAPAEPPSSAPPDELIDGSPDLPPACAAPDMRVRAHLDWGDTIDWIAGSLERDSVGPSEFTVCDLGGAGTYTFSGPESFRGFAAIDSDRDGIDDLIFIGGGTANIALWDVWSLGESGDAVAPVLIDGESLAIRTDGWPDADSELSRWFGCADLDGDGRQGLALGTYEHVGDEVRWQGEELVIRDATVVARLPGAGVGRVLPGTWGSGLPAGCVGAVDLREAAAAVCAGLEEWPGFEPFHGPTELTGLTDVAEGDVLVSFGSSVELWRDGEEFGIVALGDLGFAGAFHDGAGGLVIDTRQDAVAWQPVDGDVRLLYSPDQEREVFRLFGVERINGVPTAIIVRQTGLEQQLVHELILHPLDGSSPYRFGGIAGSEIGVGEVEWDGDRLVVVTGGHGAIGVTGYSLDGHNVDVPWDVPAEQDPGFSFDLAVGAGTVWTSSSTEFASVLQRRDPTTGEVLAAHTVAGGAARIELFGEQLLVTVDAWGDQCIQVFDPDTGELTPLRRGGTASVG